VQPYTHAAGSRVLRDSLESKETATTHDCGFDPVIFIPTVHASVSIKDFCEQLIHEFPSANEAQSRYTQQTTCHLSHCRSVERCTRISSSSSKLTVGAPTVGRVPPTIPAKISLEPLMRFTLL